MLDSHDSVAEMTAAYAEQAVKAALAFDARLDYSENSLMELESLLDKVSSSRQLEDAAEACKMWGSYLGEVVRRRFGGEWSIETYPGKDFATLTLSVGGAKLFPTMKIHRRLTRGSDDNLWTFYKMVKDRLEAAPGGKIQ
jgi:hypothetical protein